VRARRAVYIPDPVRGPDGKVVIMCRAKVDDNSGVGAPRSPSATSPVANIPDINGTKGGFVFTGIKSSMKSVKITSKKTPRSWFPPK
jgi:hypothetical protein